MAFDPSDSVDPLEQGFTSCEIEELPCEVPSRSLAQNLWQSEKAPGIEARARAFGFAYDYYVKAHKDAQFGEGTFGDAKPDEPGGHPENDVVEMGVAEMHHENEKTEKGEHD